MSSFRRQDCFGSKYCHYYRQQLQYQPVGLRGEDAEHGRPVVDLQHVCQRLQNIKVEEGVAGDGAVQPGFEERRPVTLQHSRWTAVVVLTNARHSGENHLRGRDEKTSLQVTALINTSHCLYKTTPEQSQHGGGERVGM